MAILSKGHTFADGDDVTSTKANNLVDQATFVSGASGTTDDSTLEVNGSGRLQVKDSGVTTGKLAASAVTTAKLANSTATTDGVTFPKMRYIDNLKVIGNVSGGSTTPSEVSILDEDDMASDSATSLATQQSIKAYVDTGAWGGSSYAGGESLTLPNGMVMKIGTVTIPGDSTATVTFAAAFPTACVNVQLTLGADFLATTDEVSCSAYSVTASGFTVKSGVPSVRPNKLHYWMAIGY